MSYANFEDLDQATASLIVQLQLDDLQEIRELSKGKGREGELSDTDLSVKLYDAELVKLAHVLRDTLVTRSIASAIRSDQQAIQFFVEDERRAYQDRQFACRLGGIKPPQESILAICSGKTTNKEAEQSSSSSSTSLCKGSPEEIFECEICFEEIDVINSARLPCNHIYCGRCLQKLFNESLSDETLFPPRCCRQHIIVEQVAGLLTSDLIASFKEKKIEFDTKDKTYCSSPTCSKFIHPENIEDERASCPHCNTTTCTICKFGAHDGDCPSDTTLAQVLALATQSGWQRCSSCKRIIELDTGCYHITCPCTAQFCYLCGVNWKKCTCRRWDENQLVRRANQLVDREPRNIENREVALARQIQNLQERHNCDHRKWFRVNGRHRCEECRNKLPDFILECRQCQLQACVRCRMNRL